MKSYTKRLNLLVADIASYQDSADFPTQRNYDPFTGHSWAAGLAPFADGNNQESSSEAIQAWNGITLWARLINNPQLEQSAQWMLSNEAHVAQTAWRETGGIGNFTSPLVDINWGGKRTYETFFSNLSSAKLGIQLIPLNPMMTSFASDGATIDRLTSASISQDNFNVPLGDYSLMYYGLRNPQKALDLSTKQTSEFIDDGNSRTYLTAWIMAQLDK
jgi:endoglucanase Acf2